MPAASADRPSVPIVTATIVIFAPNDRSSHMMRFDALPTKLRLCLMPLRMGIIAFFETVAFSALRFFSTTDKSDLLISSSSYAQLNNMTCSSLVADSTKTFAHSISCLEVAPPFKTEIAARISGSLHGFKPPPRAAVIQSTPHRACAGQAGRNADGGRCRTRCNAQCRPSLRLCCHRRADTPPRT